MSYTPDGLFSDGCLACLQSKAQAGDEDAQRALHYLACLTRFMACRLLTGNPSDPCDQLGVRKIPQGFVGDLDSIDCSSMRQSNGELTYKAKGFTTSLINDPDWDRRGNTP